HQFILSGIDLEAAVISEGRVQQSQRMGELNVAGECDLVAYACAVRRGAPLPNAVEREDGCFFKGAGEKRTGGGAFLMIEKDKTVGGESREFPTDGATEVQFLLQPQRHGLAEAAEAGRRVGQVRFEQAFKFRKRLIVEGDAIQLLRL